MSTTDIASLIERLAARYIWWQDPREAMREPRRVIARVMELGDYADVEALDDAVGDDALRAARRSAHGDSATGPATLVAGGDAGMKLDVGCALGPVGCSAPLMSPGAGRWPSPPSLLRYAEHPTGPSGERRGCSTTPKLQRVPPKAAEGRRSEVKGEDRAQPGPEDMSSVGLPPPSARPDPQRTRRLMRRGWREARWSN